MQLAGVTGSFARSAAVIASAGSLRFRPAPGRDPPLAIGPSPGDHFGFDFACAKI
uniref:hypothetical protein n=1 Tax=Sphingomonas populi TaxID=2484750 RepID=UPI001E5C87A2|nr:hypothetical protein [Sphingomonas populi]